MTDKRLDDMLSRWPLVERSPLEWDEAAERVVSAVATPPPRGEGAPSDEALLAPPLPESPEEGQNVPLSREREAISRPGALVPGLAVENKMSKERTRDRTSFQELAKMANTPPPPSTQTPAPPSAASRANTAEDFNTDSGIVDLKAIATADPSGAHRAKATPLASQGLFDDDHPPAAPAAASSAPPASHAGTAPAVAQPAPTRDAKTAARAQEKKGGGGVLIVLGTLAAVGALAAGAFFVVKSHRARHEATATASVSSPEKTDSTKLQAAATPTASGALAQADEIEDNTIDIANAPPGTKPRHHRGLHPKAVGGPATPTPAASAAGPDPNLVANIPTPTATATGGDGNLAEAMKAAAGGGTGLGQGSGGTSQGPKYAPGSVPQRPSQGQVQGAIGAVMQTVKGCLNSDDPMARAYVVFQSDGTVKSVTVTGAGKTQEACIKQALSKAHVDPFAEATYSIPVSIRP